jgi:hypothetical protein
MSNLTLALCGASNDDQIRDRIVRLHQKQKHFGHFQASPEMRHGLKWCLKGGTLEFES